MDPSFLEKGFTHLTKVCPRTSSDIVELTKQFKTVMDTLRDNEIVCVDETGFCNLGNATFSYFPKGQRPTTIHAPRRERASLVMAIHPEKGIVASSIQYKAFNSQSFACFVKDQLLPNIPKTTKALIMDNVSFHKNSETKNILEKHGILPLFIPPYSPRCNPIEEVFSILKHHFRKSFTSLTFDCAIDNAVKKVKEYKDISSHYRHTRTYLSMINDK